MPKVLRADYKLEKNKSEVYLTKRDGTGPKFDVHPLIAAMITFFNGYRSDEEIIHLTHRVFKIEPSKSADLVHKIYERFSTLLVEREQTQYGCIPNPNESLNTEEYIFKASPRALPERLPAPVWLNWNVTCSCHRNCIYCYMNAKKSRSADDAIISTTEVKRIIDEAADLGVCGILLTGGEPFLRKDLPQLIEYISSKNMHSYVITKFALDKNTAGIIKNPLLRLEISFDAPDEKIADALTGTPGFFREMVESFKTLSAQGVNYTVVPTLNSMNVHQAANLISFLYGLGVKSFRFARYGRSYGRHRDSLFISDREYMLAKEKIHEERDKIGDPSLWISFGGDTCDAFSDAASIKPQTQEINACGAGRHVLIFRQDGKAVLCEKMLDDAWVYGDLRKQSILEVWDSPVLQDFVSPSRELFAGTDCNSCKVFDTCRGKTMCIYYSHIQYGKYYIPLP